MHILVIDNYDSFTYNLVHYLETMCEQVDVIRNDMIALQEIERYDRIVYSPGPGIPSESEVMFKILHNYADCKPILGICLGHQAIAEFFGGSLTNLDHPLHGRSIPSFQSGRQDPLFQNIPESFDTGRYHSWGIRRKNMPSTLQITAMDDFGYVMGLKHQLYNIRGLQFHPESVLTPYGKTMLQNWIEFC